MNVRGESNDHWMIRNELLYADRIVPCYAERPQNLDDMLARVVAAHGERPAIVDGRRTIDYRELDRQATRIATALAGRGIAAGDRVALFLGNRAEFLLMLCGVWRLGAIVVPIGIRQSAAELEYMLNQCEASAICFEESLADRLPAPDRIASVRLFIGIADDENRAGRSGGAGTAQTLSWESLVSTGSDERVPCPLDDQAPACIMYTSGTTGHPKGAVLSHLGFEHTARNYERCFGYVSDDRMLLTIPATHISGLLAVVLVMLRIGGCVVCARSFRASRILETIARERITAAVMVPSMYNLCLLEPDMERHDLSSWRIGHFGGAAMPEVTIRQLAQRVPGLELYNGFGATETTSAVTLTERGDATRYLDSVGTILPCVDIRVLDEAGKEVAAGEAGELWIRSPGNAIGYWENEAATRQAFVAGYWRSGDIGSVDDKGYLRVFDRIKDMINRGGYKVYCVELENVVQSYRGIVEAAAVASPCPVLGERTHVFVHALEPVNVDALRAFCAQHLAEYKVPDFITVSPEPLPRNLNGKLVKAPLRERAARAADVPNRIDKAGMQS